MKYYLIVGEASGDLHASHLMRSLQKYDKEAEFRFIGGDNMKAVGGTCVRHYKTLAYMGFVPVLLHLRTIKQGMEQCKRDIVEWQPDIVIPVDYAGFNLSIAKYLHDLKTSEPQNLKTSKPQNLLLHRPEAVGMEGIPHQELQTRHRRDVLHTAFRG